MNVSVLLRLIPSARTGGRLAGQAELVETGETTVFTDHEEMLAFLRKASAGNAVSTDGPLPGSPEPPADPRATSGHQ